MLRKGTMIPPGNCVNAKLEQQASLGYRGAMLLSEIQRCGSLVRSCSTARIEPGHGRDLLLQLNHSFPQPLVTFVGKPRSTDLVMLTAPGEAAIRRYWKKFAAAQTSPLTERSHHY